MFFFFVVVVFFFQAEDGIRDRSPSRGLGDVYKRQEGFCPFAAHFYSMGKNAFFLRNLFVNLLTYGFSVSIWNRFNWRDSCNDHCQDDSNNTDTKIKWREQICNSHGVCNHQTERDRYQSCLLYTSPSPRDGLLSRMPSSA